MSDKTTGQGPSSPDEFDRELRALTEGSAGEARFRELSAAERAKAGTKKPRRRGKGRGRLVSSLVLVAVLAAGGGIAWLRFGHPSGKTGGKAPSASPVASVAGPAPSGTITPVNLFGGPPVNLFAGTPAAGWADGAAGIVPPAARPIGGFTAAQAASAYATTRKLLIATALDRKTLLGGAPTAFARLLFGQERKDFLAGLNKTGTARDGAPRSTRSWVISFAPGSTALIGSVIKVHGTMSARATTYSGFKALAVKVNYRFVYPVEPPGVPADWMRVVGSVSGTVYFGDFARSGASFVPWVLFDNSEAGDRCGDKDGYGRPDFPDHRSGTRPSGPAVDPYSMASQPDRPGSCQAVTRT